MKPFWFRRIAILIPLLLGLNLILFFLIQSLPGGPLEQRVAAWNRRGAAITEDQKHILSRRFGFDKPLIERYGNWLQKSIQFDFGDSYYYDISVLQLIKQRLPITLALGLLSFLLTYTVCVPLGLLKAYFQGSLFDKLSSAFLLVVYSIPAFALGIGLLLLLSAGKPWSVFPIAGVTSENFSQLHFFGKVWDLIFHLCLPVIALSVGGFATLTRLTKQAILDETEKSYFRAARAKGGSEWHIFIHHAFRGALLTISTQLREWPGILVSGSLLVETTFNIQGVGRLMFDSIYHRDYPVIVALLTLLSFAYLIGNFVCDLLCTQLDPRTRQPA